MTVLTAALGLSDAGIIAVLGYGVVFLGLILLMVVVSIVGKAFSAQKKAVVVQPPVQEAVSAAPVAPGAAGQLKLHDVDPKIAAMLMAIVADKMGKPINELRFISIKEVK
jgi:Na+-transporting methylmalonyl-CoA/oxaloacetate decarboxylase gamma subunit